jgi:molybdopterin/thiamine biosynthesis adenylyltransferase
MFLFGRNELEGKPIMTWDRVERLIGSENLSLLATKRVGVVGLGSGGGFVAQALAMSGVRRFVLVDDDVLETGNLVRHVADRRELGRPKAEAVADLIRQRNPEAEIETRVGRIEQHLDALDHLDLLVVGVDGEQVKYKINEACLARDRVAVYAGVYERGEGGDVVLIHPYDGPCYACWAAELREGLAVTQGPTGQLDYGMIGPEGTLEAEPALWLHVVRVAAAQADLALKELLRDTDRYQPWPANTLILANSAIEIIEGQITPPHSALWVEITRDPNCLVCGDPLRASRIRAGDEDTAEAGITLDSLGAEFEDESGQRSQGKADGG